MALLPNIPQMPARNNREGRFFPMGVTRPARNRLSMLDVILAAECLPENLKWKSW